MGNGHRISRPTVAALALASCLGLAGCSAAAPTPQIVYVTPPPTSHAGGDTVTRGHPHTDTDGHAHPPRPLLPPPLRPQRAPARRTTRPSSPRRPEP